MHRQIDSYKGRQIDRQMDRKTERLKSKICRQIGTSVDRDGEMNEIRQRDRLLDKQTNRKKHYGFYRSDTQLDRQKTERQMDGFLDRPERIIQLNLKDRLRDRGQKSIYNNTRADKQILDRQKDR